LSATRWAAANAEALGTIPGFVVIGGDSAGGNMAAVTALRCRDEGGPALAGQLLIYPVTDHYSANHPSYTENAEGYGLSRPGMRWFWDHYLASPDQGTDPLASPMRAVDLSVLPPALVLTAEYDPLRDEGEAYGARLTEAGVDARTVRFDGVNHGFFALKGWVARADTAVGAVVTWLKTIAASA
jgi:acetyl esterase